MPQTQIREAPVARSTRRYWPALLLATGVVAALTYSKWSPALSATIDRWKAGGIVGAGAGSPAKNDPAPNEHAGHDHGAAALDSLDMSQQARDNIGLKLVKVELRAFDRAISVPGIVAERPGRSIVEVTAPLTGVVTRVYAIGGEAVQPGQPLFDMRLTHEELVQAQADFLRTAEELDVIAQEVKRLEKVSIDGAVAGKTVLERKYEQQRQQAVLRAQKQALLLHGLAPEQVEGILKDRTLLQNLLVATPNDAEAPVGGKPLVYQIQRLKVEKGQHVAAGDTLAVLADHSDLYVEGTAFERDMSEINKAVENGRRIVAVLETPGTTPITVPDLELLYVSGQVDADSRAFHFYVRLPNELLRDARSIDGHRFVAWRFKPGQRMQLQVPVETWKDRIVLPLDAVAQDGVETYVFLPNGKKMLRKPVHVEYRDALNVVIANDGSLFPGDVVAINGAAQLQLALKNKAGGAVDPHAGHNH